MPIHSRADVQTMNFHEWNKNAAMAYEGGDQECLRNALPTAVHPEKSCTRFEMKRESSKISKATSEPWSGYEAESEGRKLVAAPFLSAI
jgi:hypothetical protein